ncbi:tubulin binding cofactor A [Syncephalastrum racemosum]|uniref:Tubulin-specific chaperone A n=1 Tax=Syncephalastrum racemosum TaxID=13706 RepID=A0A1X2HU49_SYNRA|nr:tubulin binding cofactor A [Syncephalastrum racemosum]
MTLRELKIKTNVVKRIAKEQIAYGKEAEDQQKRIDKLVQAKADDADIRKQKEVLDETLQMIPDVKRRLAAAYKDLEDKVEDPAYAGSAELQDAKAVLAETVVEP